MNNVKYYKDGKCTIIRVTKGAYTTNSFPSLRVANEVMFSRGFTRDKKKTAVETSKRALGYVPPHLR